MPRIPAVVSSQGTNAAAVARPATVTTPLQREHTGDRQTQATQEAANSATLPSRANPLGNGNLVQGVSFTAGASTPVNHLLGRKWVGYFPTKVTTNGATFKVDTTQPANLDDKQITLVASANCTADLWIFG